MDNQRLILFLILSFILFLLWESWQKENTPVTTPSVAAAPAAGGSAPNVPSASTPAAPAATPGPSAPVDIERGERIHVTTDMVDAEIDTAGGDLRRLALRKHPVAADKKNEPFVLFTDEGSVVHYSQSGLLARDGVLPDHKARWRADKTRYTLAEGEKSVTVELRWAGKDGTQVTKRLTFHRNSYVVDVAYEIRNGGRKPIDAFLYAQLLRSHVENGGLFALPSYTGPVVYSAENKYEKIARADLAKKPYARQTTGGWAALLQLHFVDAWLPDAKARSEFYSKSLDNNRYLVGYNDLTATPVAPGASATLSTRLYAGPKEQHRLEQVEETLRLTVDYGWLTFLAAPLFWLLEWIHKLIGNWGWSIVVLTILIKAVFHPLSVSSYRSMAQMRKLQPRLQALKERFGDDKQKMQQAMMEMYKTEKINPLGGCLPILVQIPVFIALYWVLLESVELRQAPWALWIQDLSVQDPYYVLPLLMGATMLIQTLLNPQPMEPIQKKIMIAMPIVFTVFFLFFPAGLVLYWVVQNILSIAQQWVINRQVEGAKA